jgi:hypothetical protein
MQHTTQISEIGFPQANMKVRRHGLYPHEHNSMRGVAAADWAALNDTVDGRLLIVVPPAKTCWRLRCTEEHWKAAFSDNPFLAP